MGLQKGKYKLWDFKRVIMGLQKGKYKLWDFKRVNINYGTSKG